MKQPELKETAGSPDASPRQVAKQQQKRLALVLLGVGILGVVAFSWLTGPSSTSRSGVQGRGGEVKTATAVSDPLSHVDEEGVWVERVQNELKRSQKTADSLQQQLQLLTQAKTVQEQASQNQIQSVQALQQQVRELQDKLHTPNNMSTQLQSASLTHTPVTSPSATTVSGIREDHLMLTASPQKAESLSTPSKTPDTFVPAGTFVRAVMLGGADAPAGVTSQSNPAPVLLRLLDPGTLPNHRRSHLKDCVATAAVLGDISSERGEMRLERLSCVSSRSEVVEMPVEGTVFGPEGKNGVRGVPLWREGALLERAFIAGTLSGFSQGIASQYTTTSVSPTGTVNSINNSDIFKFGAAQGVSNAMDKVADYNIRRADQYHPVIQLSAGTIVDVVFLKGFYLDGQKHDHEGESVLPPFAPATAIPTLRQSDAQAVQPDTVKPEPALAPLPLTSTQIEALKTNLDTQQNF